MSGGWIMRAHLARLLVMEPDLLLLDEPTNHLDLESLYWFQEYLQSYPGAILMISHDREFLNALVDSIVEISHQKLNRYRGNWDKYVVEKVQREEVQLAAYKNQQKEIASLQEFADRFRAKASKASQAQSKLKQIDRMEKIEAPLSQEKTVHMRFPQPPRSGIRSITLKDIDFAYGDLVVYDGMEFEAERGQRTVLVGPNGAGKSTLLKLLSGNLTPARGTREVGHNVKVGYFSQHRMESLNAKHTVLEAVQDMPNPVGEQQARTVLGSFLFRGDDVFKSAGYRIGPSEVENCLVRHPAVANAAVVPKPDAERGAVVKAYVVLAPGHAGDEALVQALQRHVRDRLAPYEYPKEIEFVASLPMTTTGKVQRRVLRLQEEQRAQEKAALG